MAKYSKGGMSNPAKGKTMSHEKMPKSIPTMNKNMNKDNVKCPNRGYAPEAYNYKY